MKQVKSIVFVISVWIVCYLIFCFGVWEIDPGLWSSMARTMYCFASFALSVMVLMITLTK